MKERFQIGFDVARERLEASALLLRRFYFGRECRLLAVQVIPKGLHRNRAVALDAELARSRISVEL